MSHIFISYSRKDIDFAQKIVDVPVESVVEVGLVRAARLREAVLRSAFEGRL